MMPADFSSPAGSRNAATDSDAFGMNCERVPVQVVGFADRRVANGTDGEIEKYVRAGILQRLRFANRVMHPTAGRSISLTIIDGGFVAEAFVHAAQVVAAGFVVRVKDGDLRVAFRLQRCTLA